MPELLLLPGFLDPPTLELILRDVRRAGGAASPVYGGKTHDQVDPRVRRVERLSISETLETLVSGLLEGVQENLSTHFGTALGSFEPVQFLRYREGDFFVPHQDGNTPVVRDQTLDRRVSVVIFLNAVSPEPGSGTYGGGSLVLHGPYPNFDERHEVPATPGALAAFPSETTHEVTPVTHGCRYTIVSWYRRA